MALADDPQLHAAVEEAMTRPPAGDVVQLPPPSLILTGLAVEVGPVVFQGQQAVVITIKNHIGHASIPVALDAVDQIVEQIQAAKAQARGLHVATNGNRLHTP